MLQPLRVFPVCGMLVVSLPSLAAGQEPSDSTTSQTSAPDSSAADTTEVDADPTPAHAPARLASSVPLEQAETHDETGTKAVAQPTDRLGDPTPLLGPWQLEVHGYFRAPLALGISVRPNPDQPNGPAKGQISYAPNRTVDASYYSFAYTRLQEQDWAELTFHLKRTHVDAAVGWMGYWYAAAGFRNPDAAAIPGVASLTLDADFDVAGVKSNVAVQMGAWWPSFGYFEKYDTYTLGRFHQIGEQIRLTAALDPDLIVTLDQGFGTGRDGAFSYNVAASSPLYASKVGADLLGYVHARLQYKKYMDVGLHYNHEWSRDPYLTADASPTDGKAYSDAAQAHLSVAGAELTVRAGIAGRLWLSPSYVSVKNGWALGNNGGTEVMHALGGQGVAANYLAWTNSPSNSSGSGSMVNFGFLYENSLSNVQGKTEATATLPDVTLNLFGLLTNASLALPATTTLKQSRIKQLKYGADVNVRALSWLALMVRGDTVNYDLDNPGLIFSALTARLSFFSHYLSGESIYLQYSRYIYGDRMVLAGQWPWGTPLVAGSDVIQGGAYAGKKPDMDVIKLQATVAF